MDRLRALLDMTCRLTEAVRGNDWEALTQADSALAALLPLLVQQGSWSTAEHAALDNLRKAHRQASEHCTRELARLDDQLAGMRANKDGWLAYAQNDELEESRP